MYTPPNNSEKSKHPILIELDGILKKDVQKEKRDELFLNFYKRNLSFFDDLENANTNITISKFIYLKIMYIRILDDKGEYKKGKMVADQLEVLIGKLDKNYYEYNTLYIASKKWIAINLGRLKKYRASNRIFKELLKLDESKEFYQRWIVHNTEWIVSPYAYTLAGILLLWSFRKVFFSVDIAVPFGFSLLIIILIGLLLIYIFFSHKIIHYFVVRRCK